MAEMIAIRRIGSRSEDGARASSWLGSTILPIGKRWSWSSERKASVGSQSVSQPISSTSPSLRIRYNGVTSVCPGSRSSMRATPGCLASASRTHWPRSRTACGSCQAGSVEAASCRACALPWSGTIHGARTTLTMVSSVPLAPGLPSGSIERTVLVMLYSGLPDVARLATYWVRRSKVVFASFASWSHCSGEATSSRASCWYFN